ncbi:DUF3048 domain-containing protein [Anaerobacillus isosaccharinicus]|uniref:DUF3048 domain-containing protein n=1 Tax=Anaerobacillus isosaccharinicus TaxID=1532552 RepID=A0A7S7RDA4_9BACI|nr:DUF3048 domain-containing protein [Anaerobacillus isosaccharinicus]MBA5588763.1 DUF3048 domain-containing protein [Anaerobacillus isosaccharinicus]QOY37837.1 DUF3048 domain-containing protein [Anaerobacillus isosaccharinicus]
MKRLTLGFIFLLLIILVVACTKEEKTVVPEEPAEVEVEVEEPEPEEKKEVFLNTFPLTGMGTNDEVSHRAFGVMIENTRSARPQSGIYQADLVYEVLSEATITRLLAFFHSEKPEIIGPVRSARDYYINLNNGYNGIYVSAGGSPQAFAMFQRGQVDYISGLDYDGRFFYRSKDRRAPHNMYTNYENLIKAAEHAKRSLTVQVPSLPFLDEDTVISGDNALEISINYGSSANNVVYQFDKEQKKYSRIVGGEQSLDLETKTPVLIDNIFVVEMSHRVIDDVGRRAIDITSGGEGLLIQNGVYQTVQWQNVDGQILPVKNGEALGFLRGKTWINVVPNLDANVGIN